MLRLLVCEFAKLRRRPLFFAASLLSVLIPLAFALFLDDAENAVEAVNNMMSCLIQLSSYLLLMPVGGLLCFVIVLLQGWEPVGFWKLFFVGLGEGILMWTGALPCVLLVTAFNKSYIISVIITFFYTLINYILTFYGTFATQPFGLNPGTLLPGPLSFRWHFQFFDLRDPSAELEALLEKIRPFFVDNVQAFGVAIAEAVVFLVLIAVVYRRQDS